MEDVLNKNVGIVFSIASLLVFYTYLKEETDSSKPRSPASIPANYASFKGCEKQELLWDKALSSIHQKLPDYQRMGLAQLVAMAQQELHLKESFYSDFAPEGWKKYLHRRGALAKIKVVAKNNKYTGLFQGAPCGLLRLSLTYKTAGSKPVAPGLALKVLRDGTHSSNISALVSLDGQAKDYNFFKNAMSNIVPMGKDFGQKIVHNLFRRVSNYPEEMLVSDMAKIDSDGLKESRLVTPRQLFFVPGPSLQFLSLEHDVRNDFLKIPAGTMIYKIFAVSDKYVDFNYSNYSDEMATTFLKDSEYVADIVSTSEFIASEFGDDGIFFRHQLRP